MTDACSMAAVAAPKGVNGPLHPLEGEQRALRSPSEPGNGPREPGLPRAADWAALPGGVARPDERRSEYCAVTCGRCGAVVRAAKFSVQHTSVQWDAAAVLRCAEFAERVAAGEVTPLIERCEAIRDSIEAAAAAGRLPVAPP